MKVLIIFLLYCGVLFAQAENLKGIKDFSVKIFPYSDPITPLQNNMKFEAELLLRSYNINPHNVDPSSYLAICLYDINSSPNNIYYFTISFYRKVRIAGVKHLVSVSVWEYPGAMGILSNNGLHTEIIELMKERVKYFINDYLSVNR